MVTVLCAEKTVDTSPAFREFTVKLIFLIVSDDDDQILSN